MGALPSLELVCFGSPTARVGGRSPDPEVLWSKHLAFLTYLALSPGHRRSRDHLMGLLWGESPQDKAAHALNQTVSILRRCLGERRLVTEGASVELSADGLDVDALRVLRAWERAPDEAVGLMRGEFLEGFHVKRAHEYDDWMARERRNYAELRVRVLTAAGARALAEGRAVQAAAVAGQALEAAQHSEAAIALRMRALALAGDASAALSAYHDFAERLGREIHERPGKTLEALAERIRAGTWRAPVTSDAPSPAPLIGRPVAHREVFETLDRAWAAGPCSIVIGGAPGMGRSRLLGECHGRAGLAGARVLRARQLETDHDARWSALRQLFREGLAQAPGMAGAPPDALSVVAAFVPDLAQRFPPRAAHDVAEVGASIASVLQSIAAEQPVLLALDDAHWADGPSLAALHAAMAAVNGPVALVLSVATGAGEPARELVQLQADVGVGIAGVGVRLDPLTQDDVRALVTALAPWCDNETERERRGRWLWTLTGGSPLFAVTVLGALEKATRWREQYPPPEHTDIAPLPVSVPKPAYWAVRLRIRELADHEIVILRAAAIGGLALDLDLIAALVQRPRDEVESALPSFERRHLVHHDGTRHAFVARLVVEVVRDECFTPGERKRMESLAVDELERREDLESRALRSELLARVRPDAAARTYMESTLQAAAAADAQRVARRVRAALEALNSPSAPPRRS